MKLGFTIEDYVTKIINGIKNSHLSDRLKHDVLMKIEHFQYKDRTVIWIRVPEQVEISWLGDQAYIRVDSDSLPATPKQIANITTSFM